MSDNIYTKDPSAVLDYTIDWEEWLCAEDFLTAAAWTVPTGITRDSDSFTTTTATIWLSGGTVGEDYELPCHIDTNDGREDDRTITIRVRDR